MAGFEVVVRPVVFPDIRPAPAQPVLTPDDPEGGFATIRGQGARQIDLSSSFSASTTSGKAKETERRVDTARVYQKKDNGTINRENFVDIEVANRIKFKTAGMPVAPTGGGERPGSPFREIYADRIEVRHYKRVGEEDNIEVKDRDKIKKNTD